MSFSYTEGDKNMSPGFDSCTYLSAAHEQRHVQGFRVEMWIKKAEPLLASRSLNVLMKIEKTLNHKGFWPLQFRENL